VIARHAGSAGSGRLRVAVILGAVAVAFAGVAMVAGAEDRSARDVPSPGPANPESFYRAFDSGSWWNTPLPNDAPMHSAGAEILDYLRTGAQSREGCLLLAGAGESRWGQPIYWARPSDPVYDVTGLEHDRPPELARLRIPTDAQPADNSDDTMTIYDLRERYVVALTGAEYDEDDDSWTARGGTVTYLDSNGLHVATGLSDDRRNRGTHRGNNGATMAVAWEEVREGAVRHVLKVASGPEVANRHVFPMVGSDGDYEGKNPRVPPQGLRMRIKPSVDLGEFELNPDALVIARALQRYGFYIGDSGGRTSLKLENTVAEGRGQLWNLRDDALCSLPFTTDYWDVVAEGYDPSR